MRFASLSGRTRDYVWQRGELNQEQEQVLERLGMRIPPREWALSIEGLPGNLLSRKRPGVRDTTS